jgi:vancomycin permeability regulator SanA
MTVSIEPQTRVASRPRRWSARRVLGVLLGLVLVAAIAVPAVALVRVLTTANADELSPSDVVVVMGAAQFWGRPSPVLEARLNHAADLVRSGVSTQVVTVGGNQPGDRTTEAQVGRDWLVSKGGIDAAHVTAVPDGHDTLSSLTVVAQMMQQRGWSTATIVTDPAHEARSVAMARALGIDARASSTREGPGSSLTIEYVARETSGLAWFWVVERRGVEPVVSPSA